VVDGLDLFRDRFQGLEDDYVIIGGTACDLVHSESGIRFRRTKDLDIVIVLEGSPADFARRLWAFVAEGGYATARGEFGRSRFYRFENPTDHAFPVMIELLSRRPIREPAGGHLAPLPLDGYLKSLSIIVLDDSYYELIRRTRTVLEGIPTVPASTLIALKAKAYLELTKLRGEDDSFVRADDIRKHRNDVFRLLRLLAPEDRMVVGDSVARDLTLFLTHFPLESPEWSQIIAAVNDPDLPPPDALVSQLRANYTL